MRRIGRVEGRVGRESEQPVKLAAVPCGSAPFRLKAHADLERVLAAPARLDPRERVVEVEVANQVLRVVVARSGDVVGMRVLRADVERIDAGEADEVPVCRRTACCGPCSRLSRTCPNFSSLVVRLFSTDVHDTL